MLELEEEEEDGTKADDTNKPSEFVEDKTGHEQDCVVDEESVVDENQENKEERKKIITHLKWNSQGSD